MHQAHRRLTRVPFFALTTSLTLAFAASVSAQSSARLDYSVDGEGCPDSLSFARSVMSHSGPSFEATGTRTLRVRGFHDAAETTVTIELDERQRIFRNASCQAAVEAAAEASAQALRPSAVAILRGSSTVNRPTQPQVPVPSAGYAPQAEAPRTIRIRVSANEEDLSLHLQTGTGTAYAVSSSGHSAFGVRHDFRQLCLLPCDTQLEMGTHRFGLSELDGIPAVAGHSLQLEQDSELHFRVRRRSILRPIGFYVMMLGIVGIVTGGTLALLSSLSSSIGDERSSTPGWAILGAGAGVMLGGILMMSLSEKGGVDIDVRPM